MCDSRLYTDPKEADLVWSVRKSGSAATNALPGEQETYPGWEDAAVDPARVGDYLRDFRKLLDRYGYKSSLYGHFGDGCIHGRMTFDLSSAGGRRQVAPVHGSCRGSGGVLRRVAVRRARRWPGAGRAVAAHVRPGADGGVPAVQGDLGSAAGG